MNIYDIPRKAPGEKKRHPADFWREQKLERHTTRGGRGVVGRLIAKHKKLRRLGDK